MADLGTGGMVTLATSQGDTFQAYVAGAEDAGKAVLIFHEWGGLKDHNRQWADSLAKRGYRCMVLDLYDGRITDNAEEASHWIQELDQDRIDATIRAVLGQLATNERPTATLGYSMGGKQALHAALLAPEAVHAVILGYCRLEGDANKLKLLRAPVLVVYAQREQAWPVKQQDFEALMQQLGKHSESLSVDAAQGFTDPSGTRYDRHAAESAWKATVSFLDTHLN